RPLADSARPVTLGPRSRHLLDRDSPAIIYTQLKFPLRYSLLINRHSIAADSCASAERSDGTLKIYGRITPRVKLRARPAPSHPTCDTSCCQLLHTVLPARQLQRFR